MCRGGRLFHKITRSQVDPDSLEINNNGVKKKSFCSILNNIFLKAGVIFKSTNDLFRAFRDIIFDSF